MKFRETESIFMPTPQQSLLIRTLRRLHAAREPLNITAVKRRHPELLKAVMAVTPYWGWKRALEDAGIKYSRIKVELLDGIECALCGKWWRRLAGHLRRHDTQSDEYRMDYPESDLVCEEFRAKQMKKESAPIPHWERLWSREYALDRLAEYHRRGIPINRGALLKYDFNLLQAILRHTSGWKQTLIVLGLNPEQTTRNAWLRSRRYPDTKSVIEEIRRRKQKGLSLFHAAIVRQKGHTQTDKALISCGVEYFGSWDNALRAAGIDPATVRLRQSKHKTGRVV